MDKNKQILPQAADSDLTIKFWGNIVLAVIGILADALLLRNVLQLPATTISHVVMAFYILVILSGFTVILLTLRGRQKLGAQLAFYTVVVLFVSGPFFYTGRALTSSISLIIVSAIIILQLFPKEFTRRSIVITGTALIIIWVTEWMNPPWRLSASTASGVVLVASILFALILGAIVIRQSRNRIISSIRIQITVWTGLLVAILAIVLVAYSIITGRQAAIHSAEAEALAIAKAQAEGVENQVAPALDAARTLAYSLGMEKDPVHPISLTRDQANGILREVAEKNPTFLGTWTIWEPNAFDGQDAQYVNAPLHDSTGRFIPYWVRVYDAIHGEAVRDYETPGIGDFYVIPRQTRKEMLISPFYYEVGGKQVLMTSLVVPIVENDRFYGVTGVDLKIDFVQSIVDEIDLYGGTATAVLVTDTGILVAVRNQPDQSLQPAASLYADFEQIRPRIAADETFISPSPDGKNLRVFAPVIVGETGSHSSLSLIIPFSAITASATALAIREVVIGLSIMILSLLVLWYLTGLIVRPITDLTAVANRISAGNLDAVANVKAANETGILAKAFNSMTSQLRNMLDTLEQRVAARTRNLVLAAEVGRAVSQVRSLDVMLQDACELIRKEFDLYYVQVYLSDPSQTKLVLEAGTGEVGVQLVGRGHNLPLNADSINGRAAVERRTVIISDTSQSANFRPNPLLFDTRGEMAVPLMVADCVVGVLDMQSSKAGVLTEEVLPAFEALAGQLAVAIQNANLLEEAQQARAQVEAQARRLVRTGWNEHLDGIHQPEKIGFVFDHNQLTPTAVIDEVELPEDGNAVSVPIAITGEPLGSLVVDVENETQREQAAELVRVIARQMAQQIENLRLLESAERYRYEAEQAARRLTIQGWREYLNTRKDTGLVYLYDSNEVRPYKHGQETDESALTLPLKVREEAIGKLAIQGLTPDAEESLELANAVTERLSAHIESLRQYDQTQSALAQSEKLFDASRSLTQAADLQELLSATMRTLDISTVNRALMTTFSYDSENEVEQLTVVANWWNGEGHDVTPVGTRYSKEMIQLMPMFVSPTPLFFDDTFTDERVDEKTREFAKRLNLRAVAVLPLHLGSRQIGALFLEAENPHKFMPDEIRLFVSLAPQIATVLENRRQYEIAQRQAKREAMLNTINQKIQSATSVEAVLQIAARELGRALDASKAVAQLGVLKRTAGNGNNRTDP